MSNSSLDPRGVIADAYKIEGISASECRSIFLDWALEPREAADLRSAASTLAAQYAGFPAHPMTSILTEATVELSSAPKRRGGRRG
ncbi:MAG TPA: hypothetical protein EYG79_09840 [Rhodobacteraceae bacterium]|nr:hypothetical protein [Paracoccaceae bacterium]